MRQRRPAAPAGAATATAVPDPSAAAFFDVDNTMMIGASIYHFAKGLAARKFFSWHDLMAFTAKQLRLRFIGESHTHMHGIRESALAFVAGKRVEDLVSLGEEIYDEELSDKIWPGTHALARTHLDAGQRVWLVTATPQELATIISARLGLTAALGTVAETQDGVYTGHLIGDVLHGEAKARAVRELAEREGLDLTRCTAYSDSINDLPLLTMVGRAVAVNPDSALRAEARDHGWEIRDYRTARRAARVGIPAVVGVGAVGGGVAVGLALRRGRRSNPEARGTRVPEGRRPSAPAAHRRQLKSQARKSHVAPPRRGYRWRFAAA